MPATSPALSLIPVSKQSGQGQGEGRVREILEHEQIHASVTVANGDGMSIRTPVEYLPSRKLAERLRAQGIDGIKYPSAMNPGGKNIVIFNPDAVEPVKSRIVEVTNLQVSYENHHD